MMTCTCGYKASNDYVAMADQCPRCKTSPFPESEAQGRMQQ